MDIQKFFLSLEKGYDEGILMISLLKNLIIKRAYERDL